MQYLPYGKTKKIDTVGTWQLKCDLVGKKQLMDCEMRCQSAMSSMFGRYILWEAEEHGLELPWACRMGCCTACAVRVKEGAVYQPEALGVSEELKQKGYALMCVSFPEADCVLETVPEDEVYEMQFGRSFAMQALNPNAPSIERDDFALEIAQMDE